MPVRDGEQVVYRKVQPRPTVQGKGGPRGASAVRRAKTGFHLTESQLTRLPAYARRYVAKLEQELEQALIRAGEAVPEELP